MVGGASFGHPVGEGERGGRRSLYHMLIFYDSGLGPSILDIPSAIRFELEKCAFDGDTGAAKSPLLVELLSDDDAEADDDSAKFKSNPKITENPPAHSGSINVAIYIVIVVVL